MELFQKTIFLLLLLLSISYRGEAECSLLCQNEGNCTAPETCPCPPEWTGTNCETPICTPECSNGGTCIAPDSCSCHSQWTGRYCEISSCRENMCQNGGTCAGSDICACPPGWRGNQCQSAICDVGFCMNEGNCSRPNACSCIPNQWEGPRCDIAICSEGFCRNSGSCLYPDVNCTCPSDQWTGNQCEIAICSDGFCMNGGNCSYPNVNCTCPHQWEGNQCEKALCSEGFCKNDGTCSYPDTNCTCPVGWEGPQCQTAVCREGFCENGGKCLYPDITCNCTEGWIGNTCAQIRHHPITNTIVYMSAGLFALMLILLFMALLIVILCCKQHKKSNTVHHNSNPAQHTDIKDIMLENKERKGYTQVEEGHASKMEAFHSISNTENKETPIILPKKASTPISLNPAKGTSKKMASAIASEAARAGIIKGIPNIAYGVVSRAEMSFDTTNVDNEYEMTTPMLRGTANSHNPMKLGTPQVMDRSRRPSQSVYADVLPIVRKEKPGPLEYDYVLAKRKSMPHALPMKSQEKHDMNPYYI